MPPTSFPELADPNAPPDLSSALADAPLVLRVEVATISLEAQAWAGAGPGDVLATGVRLGNPVILRAGGLAVATGELCDLDGEIAVRILDRRPS
jgi:flagellar motor switch/type III secretory pathway protein FliN